MKKRLLSALLALVMVLAMLPATAFAADGDTAGGDGGSANASQSTTDGLTDPSNTAGGNGSGSEGGNNDVNKPGDGSGDGAGTGNAGNNGQSGGGTGGTIASQANTSADATHNGKAAKYFGTKVAASESSSAINNGVEEPGWYAEVVETVDKVRVTTYYKIDNGFIVSNKYYSSTGAEGFPKNPSSIIVCGSGATISTNNSSLTLDVYKSGSISSISYNGTSAFTLNIKDEKFFSEFRSTKNQVTLPSVYAEDKSVILNLTNVDVQGDIDISGAATHTVNLDNSDVSGEIKLNGVVGTKNYAQTVKVNQTGNTSRIRSSEVGAISVTGNNSQVLLTDCDMGNTPAAVKLTGTGTKLTVDGKSNVGDVTLMDSGIKSTNVFSTIEVKGGSVGDIKLDSNSKCTGAIRVNVTGGETGAIDVTRSVGDSPNPTITVTSATTGNIKMKGGSLNVNGAYAKVGNLDLSGEVRFTLGGSANNSNNTNGTATSGHHTVGALTVTSDVSLSIPADPTNTLSIGDLSKYTKNNILGGTWTSAVPAAALSTTLVYQLKQGNPATYTYYNESQLAEALVSESLGGSSARLTAPGVADNAAPSYTLKFMNGKTEWGEMVIAGPGQIKLPTSVNNVTVTQWADKNRSWPAGVMYSLPRVADVTDTWVLNASGGVTNGDVTKIKSAIASWTNPTGEEIGVPKVSLNGTVITLTGAVPTGTSELTLTLTTDAVEEKNGVDSPVTLRVPVTYYGGNSKSLVFTNVANDSLTHGVTLETDTGVTILRLSNGTKYTLNGSGLKERANNITVLDGKDSAKDTFDNNFIEVNVTASNYRTGAAKAQLVELINGSGAAFDWSKSPAMKEAVNAALATITTQQVETWKAQAKEKAWKAVNGNTGYTATKGGETGYDQAVLVVYLQVNVSDYKPNGSLTATLVPSWRVEIRQESKVVAYENAFLSVNDPNLPGNAYIAKSGTSLGTLAGEFGTVTFKPATLLNNVSTVYMHQDNTYAYLRTSNGYTIGHAGTNGLGAVVFNEIAPLVTLYQGQNTQAVVWRYDSLQAAVDDAKEGQHIDVDQHYKGSTTITVTGDARTFTIQAHGNNVVVSNTSNGLVTLNETGGLYTVQLTRDNTAVGTGTTADIAVASNVLNGTVTLSTTRAKANSSVDVTTTPAAGYLTSNLTATARTNKNTNVTVAVTKTSNNHYTFKVPEGATSITVTPTFAIDTGLPFTDIGASDPYFAAVKYVYDRGMMNGRATANGTTVFDGYTSISRAEVVTILWRLSGSPSVSTYSGFTDVASNMYYAAPVAWARSNNIMNGYGTTFGPSDPITREQLAKVLRDYSVYRGLNVTKTTTLAGYPDAGSVHDWGQAGMQWAVGNGIINGVVNGSTTTLNPAGGAQRYHAATMLMRYCQSFGL